MRLLSPNPGECADRQTILQLKIKYGSANAEPTMSLDTEGTVSRKLVDNISRVNVQPFIDENEQIQKYLESSWFTDLADDLGGEYDRLLEELAKVNELVWKLTDQAHTLKEAPDRMQATANERAAEVLYLTIELNDKRASIVGAINRLFAINVQEKIFA